MLLFFNSNMMFSGFSATKADNTVTTVSSSQSSNHHKRTILPITSRQAIIRNCSSNYKCKRKVRARQLQSLHNDILNDDKQWEQFHSILKQTIENNKGITNATVKALLFDAFDSFQSKTGSIDVQDRKIKDLNIIILQPNDDISSSLSLTKKETMAVTKIENENDVHNKLLSSKPILKQYSCQPGNSESFICNSAVRNLSSQSSVPTPTFFNNNTTRKNKIENDLHIMTITTTTKQEPSWRRDLKNYQIQKQLLSVTDSVLYTTMNNFSQIEAKKTPIQARHKYNNSKPYQQFTVPAA